MKFPSSFPIVRYPCRRPLCDGGYTNNNSRMRCLQKSTLTVPRTVGPGFAPGACMLTTTTTTTTTIIHGIDNNNNNNNTSAPSSSRVRFFVVAKGVFYTFIYIIFFSRRCPRRVTQHGTRPSPRCCWWWWSAAFGQSRKTDNTAVSPCPGVARVPNRTYRVMFVVDSRVRANRTSRFRA